MKDSSQARPPASVDWYANIVDSAPDAIVVIDPEGLICLVNQQAEALFGYSRDAMLQRPVEMLVPEAQRVGHVHLREGYFGIPTVRPMGSGRELLGRHRDGNEIPIEISLSPLRTDAGLFATATIRDATLHRQMQKQLRDFTESAPDAIVIVGADGCIQLVNRRTEELFGYQRDTLIGKPIEILVPERSRPKHVLFRDRYMDDPGLREMGAEMELAGRCKDGTEVPVEISLSPLHGSNGKQTIAAIRDVTERRAAQRRFRDLVESAPDGIVIIDASGVIALVNSQTEALLGYRRDQLIGQSVEMLVPEHLRDGHVAKRNLFIHQPEKRPMGGKLSLSARRADGSELPVEISLSPVGSGKDQVVLASIRDVSEQRKAREAVAEYAERLERSNEALQVFASTASHDLKSPLNTVVRFAEFLQNRLQGQIDNDSEELFQYIIDGGRRMQVLIDDLLAFSRVTGGEVRLEPVDLNVLLAEVEQALSAALSDSGGSIRSANLPVVNGDRSMLYQLFQNLVSNALKFRKPGSDASVYVEAEREASQWHIRVSDKGIGMSPEQADSAFDVFTRLHNTEDYPGTGLGLALCKTIVTERHSGKIWVSSEPGEGSTFHVLLPT